MRPTVIRPGSFDLSQWVCALALALCAASAGLADTVKLVEAGHSRCAILYPDDCALSERTVGKLSDYFLQQTDAHVEVIAEKRFKSSEKHIALIVVDGTEDHRLAARFGMRTSFSTDRKDAYELNILHRSGFPPLVLALGNGPEGAKYAVYRLMRELEIKGRNAKVRTLKARMDPLIKTRSVSLFNVWGMPIELTRRYNTESWSMERLAHYIDMYDFYGFNAIESHDRFNDNYLEPLFGLKREQWRRKVLKMSDVAHANGQQFFLRIWGHVVMKTPKLDKMLGPNESIPKKLKYLCPNDPDERSEWESEIRDYYVTNYAGHIDNLIGHWCDPGICRKNGCTFETPLRLQMELHEAFKALDPDFKSTFSMWYFDRTKNNPAGWARGGWAGYSDDQDLINAGILSKDVMIATATSLPGSYQENIVQAILQSGHKPAVWTWYRADHEIRPSLHVHLHERLGDYFNGLPPSARQLEWHNIERNVHAAANTANYYLAGRLMWEPEANVDGVLREFLRLTFGPENAARVLPSYLTIEKIRCHSCYNNSGNSYFTGIGTADPRRDAQTAQAALSKLSSVKIDPDYRPRIPLDVTPQQIIADLEASLKVVRDYAECRVNQLPAIERYLKAGDRSEAARLLDQLETSYSPWSLTLAGRQEWAVLNARLKELKRQLNQ